jgi:2-oxoglutarate ferredoxin oxidoreductase subunit delta
MPKGKIDIDIHMCKGCGICITGCKFDVIQLCEGGKSNKYGYPFLIAANPENCTGCSLCGQICPDSAITVWRFVKEAPAPVGPHG